MDPWHYWLIGAFILCILEMFTGDLFLLGCGVAAAGSSIAASVGAERAAQLGVFGVVSVAFIFGIRPLAKRHFYKTSDPRKSNTEAMIGLTGTVIEPIPGGHDVGRVRLGAEEWRALSAHGDHISPGTAVTVSRVDGATLVVASIPT